MPESTPAFCWRTWKWLKNLSDFTEHNLKQTSKLAITSTIHSIAQNYGHNTQNW